MDRAADVIVIGAGLIGLGIARELAGRGATVRVLDIGEPARAASWAGAGMLAPYTEETAGSPYADFCAQSLLMYPDFAAALKDETGIDVSLRCDGIVNAALDEMSATELRGRADALARSGIGARWLERKEALAFEPALGPLVVGASYVEGEGQVDNRKLGRALAAACVARGVTIRGDLRDLAIEADGRRARGVRSSEGFTAAGIVINAAGAWAGAIAGVPQSVRVAVRPIKGQMIALALPRLLMRHVTWVPGAYLVPRSDGRLLIGATVEDCGFDTRVTAGGVASLLTSAVRALPVLRDLALVESWAGLRPGTADGMPFLGPTALDAYFVAAGHFRNGILLTPATAKLVADAVEGRGDMRLLTAFNPNRLAEGPAVPRP
jgi:glycine oxidase